MAQRTYDGTLKFSTDYAPSVAVNRGKKPILAKSITTTDINTSAVFNDFESVNDKAVTYRRGTEPTEG